MGFTRYWIRPRKLDAERFARFSVACQEACKDFQGQLVDATFDDSEVRFDAMPGCETFMIERVSSGRQREDVVFEFCKTRHLPYDTVVEKCLVILKEHFPEVTLPDPS